MGRGEEGGGGGLCDAWAWMFADARIEVDF